jgi:hypothetical protein
MKPAKFILAVTTIAGLLFVIAAQRHLISKLRAEKHELLEIREQAVQAETELAQSRQMAEQQANELQQLRTEAAATQGALQKTQQELAVARNTAKNDVKNNPYTLLNPPPPPDLNLLRVSRGNSISRLRPGISTNLPAEDDLARYVFRSSGQIGDLQMWNCITRESVIAGPDWLVSQPLPLSFTDAEATGREQLRKLVEDEPSWEIDSITLHNLNETGSTKWHYSLAFRASDGIDTYRVHINMAGQPGTPTLRNRERQIRE